MRPIRHHIAIRQTAALLLGFVLMLRLVAAPFIISSPAPGIMAICSGGQIIYVSMQDGQPVETPDGATADPCPFFGIVNVVALAEPTLTPPARIVSITRETPLSILTPRAVTQRDNLSRAPPVFV